MNDYLVEYPLLLLFIVVSLGYLFGNFKIKGNGLGVAAVLFTGLAFGALDPRFSIPPIVFQLGLSIFVYSVGLSSGPVFFKAYKENGARDFLFAMSMLLLTGLTAGFFWWLFDFSAATITGIYSGSTTNTAALAGVIEFINQSGVSNAQGLEKEAVIGYTFSYPMGVLGGIFAIIIIVAILDGDVKKTIMIGDSETDANAAKAAEIPVILLENGYTEKNTTEIYHNHLIKDFIGIEKIIKKYL